MHIRLGHACNSSSTHSLIFLNKPLNGPHFDEEDSQFGWDHFVASLPDSKLNYLTYLFQMHLVPAVGPSAALALASRFLHTNPPPRGYVDHQSLISFPAPWSEAGYVGKQAFDLDYIAELKQYITLPEVAILGGSDQDEYEHPLASEGTRISNGPLSVRARYGTDWYCRKDKQYKHWTLFDRSTGDRLRFSMVDPLAPIRCSSLPELIDLKITDYCPYGCPYCYMGSTKQGNHASFETMRYMLHLADALQIFEIALGGGEPTLHPDFDKFIELAAQHRPTINLTTRNLDWVEHQLIEMVDKIGAVAVSVSDSNVDEVISRLPRVEDPVMARARVFDKLNLQIVEGTISEANLHPLLELCIPVTLLGYKLTGRGPAFAPKHDYDLLSVVAQHAVSNVSADTLFVTQHEEQLRQLDVPIAMTEGAEGLFSMYIDAVEYQFGPSSFCSRDEMHPLQLAYDVQSIAEQITQHFPWI